MATTVMAGDKVKDWQKQNQKLYTAIAGLDQKAFHSVFAPTFVSIDEKGKKSTLKEFFAMADGLFVNSKSAFIKSRKGHIDVDGNTIIEHYENEFILQNKKGGSTQIHEVADDYWQLIKGSWLVVKTVQKKFEVKTVSAKK